MQVGNCLRPFSICFASSRIRGPGRPYLLPASVRILSVSQRIAARAHDAEQQLIRTEDLSDGSTLFVFGDESDAEEHVAKIKASAPAAVSAAAEAEPSPEEEQAPAEGGRRGQAPLDEPPVVAFTEGQPDASTAAAQSEEAVPAETAAAGADAAAAASTPSEPSPADKAARVSSPAREAGSSTTAAHSGVQIPTHAALAEMKVPELRDLCREAGIAGFSKLRKGELITALTTASGGRSA